MKKTLSILLLSSAAFSSVNTWADVSPQGKLMIDRDGVKVWTYRESGNPSVNYRATTIVNSTLSGAVAVVMDLDHCPEWAPYIGKSLVLDRNTQAGTFTFRLDINFPFPLKNRDVLLTSRMSQSADGVVTIKNTVIEDPRAPVRPNFIRIDQYQGSWQFKPLPKTASGKPQVEVTTSGYAQPNGLLPIGIVNLFVHEQPFQMLRNMQDYVKNPRYQQATVVGVKELASKGTS